MADLPEFLKPRLRLFLSADIVGSTALKQRPHDGVIGSIEWSSIIQGFYAETQSALLSAWKDRHAAISEHFNPGERPAVWKVIGDEIVFAKVLTDYRQLAATLVCWCDAIQRVRKYVRLRSPRLDVKCTAWTAGFPVMNKEVVVLEPSEDAGLAEDYFKAGGNILNKRYKGEDVPPFAVDYIGPAIDIGFRLAKHSDPRKLILSVGAAYILSVGSNHKKYSDREMHIHYDGATPLKGVFGGAPYPIFWIDMAVDGDIAKLEDKLSSRGKCDADDVSVYCRKFFDDNNEYTFVPFIDEDGGRELQRRPGWYNDALKKLSDGFYSKELLDLGGEAEAEAEGEERGQEGGGAIIFEGGKLGATLAKGASGPVNAVSIEQIFAAISPEAKPAVTGSIKPRQKKRRRKR